jgi:hypothetical protein
LFNLLSAFAVQLKHCVGKKPHDSPQNPWQWRDCTLHERLQSSELANVAGRRKQINKKYAMAFKSGGRLESWWNFCTQE